LPSVYRLRILIAIQEINVVEVAFLGAITGAKFTIRLLTVTRRSSIQAGYSRGALGRCIPENIVEGNSVDAVWKDADGVSMCCREELLSRANETMYNLFCTYCLRHLCLEVAADNAKICVCAV